MLQAWLEYLSKVREHSPTYVYPVTDKTTDNHLLLQDPYKLDREQSLIAQFLDWDWKIGIDFGCGTGANFWLFDKPNHAKRLLIGIDPDYARTKMARVTAEKRLQHIESYIVCSGIKLLEDAPKGLIADAILSVQVLGHTSEAQTVRILQGFQGVLRTNCRCCIAVPVIGEMFKDNPAAGDWDGQSDFTHHVNMTKNPGDIDFRQSITLEEFNRSADKPIPGFLPVRSFFIPEFPDPTNLQLPYSLERVPPTIEKLIKHTFSVEQIVLYSIHKDRKEETFPVGDVMIFLRRS